MYQDPPKFGLVATRHPGPMGHTAYHHVGDAGESAFTALRLAAQGLAVFHGYRRNRGSIGWAIGWGMLAAFSPIITIGIALAQGVGKPKGR